MILRLTIMVVVLVGAACPGWTQERSLEDLYRLAVTQSEALQRDALSIKVAESNYREAIAAIYPQIYLSPTERIRSSSRYGTSRSADSSFDDEATSNGQRSSRETREFQLGINARQPIFTGFRERYLAKAAESEISAAQLDAARNRELLYLDVAELYFQIQLYQGDLEILAHAVKILSERNELLNRFIELGRSRISERLSIDAEKAKVLSTIENARGTMEASRELLAFLTGLPSHELSLAPPAAAEPLLPLSHYLERATRRTDLQAAEYRTASASSQLTAAEREHWPYLSVEGNLYPYEDPDLNREWDLLFKLEVPIFEGGAINARIARSSAELQRLNLTLAEAKRKAERDVRTAYARCIASQAEVAALGHQVEAAHKNLVSQREDYEVGVVNNLDVLAAIRAEQEAQRDLLTARTTLYLHRTELEVAAGDAS